jgi:glycosyltransferase involved in cell wall biosynthesis
MSYKNILIVVDRDFNIEHVGVLRVTRYHFKNLVARGHRVTLATYIDGNWVSCSALDAARAIYSDKTHADAEKPYWQSGSWTLPGITDAPAAEVRWRVKWDGDIVSPEDFDESILTNPWQCVSEGKQVRDAAFSAAIVHDTVPNMIAMGLLRMPQYVDIFQFAHVHHIGYEYFVRNVKAITCVSENSRKDFNKLYGTRSGARVDVCIPFADFGVGTAYNDPAARDVLMINVLDHRKNFLTVAKALKEASKTAKLHVVIVGRERLPREEVMQFLTDIATACASVRWYRGPSDVQLQELMTKAKVVFFPSFYEGLGLPILEAQARGVPVITSNVSSCGEINQNSVLTADPYDYKAFARILNNLLDDSLPVLKGAALREAQVAFLTGRNTLFSSSADTNTEASEFRA